MRRLEHANLHVQLTHRDRRTHAHRLKAFGLTPNGAHQAMHGPVVTDPRKRAILGAFLHRVVSAGTSLNV